MGVTPCFHSSVWVPRIQNNHKFELSDQKTEISCVKEHADTSRIRGASANFPTTYRQSVVNMQQPCNNADLK